MNIPAQFIHLSPDNQGAVDTGVYIDDINKT